MKIRFIMSLLAFVMSSPAMAYDWIVINDMSQVKWQMIPDGRVYFRNLNDFNSQALAGNYNYYINTTTDVGRSAWSVVLTKMQTSEKLILGIDDINQPGVIDYLGNW